MNDALKQASIDYANELTGMPKGIMDAITSIMRECFIAGAKWQEKQIMSYEALHCHIGYAEIPLRGVVTAILTKESDLKCMGLENGDEVKVIIVSKRKYKKG